MDRVVFRALPLAVAPGRVMTPRPASEQLVDAALACLGRRPARVADVGTGSGAVGIAIAVALPAVQVWATDTDRAAVALARENVRRHGVGDRVRVRHGDLLAPVPAALDLIVANLPYLPAAAAPSHPDLAGEPRDAVYADGDGLGPYRRLVSAARRRLLPGGSLAIQLHRRVLVTRREKLDGLAARLAVPLGDAA
jgi:release factor glutamine methyltransferase